MHVHSTGLDTLTQILYFCGAKNRRVGDYDIRKRCNSMRNTAGDFFQTVFDTEEGSILIPISGNPGNYTLMLVMASGLVFEGEFNFNPNDYD